MSMDETIMSADGTEAAAGYEPEHAFDDEYATEQGTHVEPTQVAYPWRAALRTALAVIVGVCAALLVIVPEVSAIADDTVTPLLPSAVVDVLARAAVWVTAVAALVTRVMASATVNAWLTRVGAGASPKA